MVIVHVVYYQLGCLFGRRLGIIRGLTSTKDDFTSLLLYSVYSAAAWRVIMKSVSSFFIGGILVVVPVRSFGRCWRALANAGARGECRLYDELALPTTVPLLESSIK